MIPSRSGPVDPVDDLAVPQGRGYVVPLKDLVRKAERIDMGDTVTVGVSADV